MKDCVFCNIDFEKEENTIINENSNFYVLPALGSLVEGYLLIVSKRHVNSMADLNEEEKSDYIDLINKYIKIFYNVYGINPIIFEHGTPMPNNKMRANSVFHAHTHIVNYNFLDSERIIKSLNFKSIKDACDINKNKNYIFYMDDSLKCYVSYNFPSESQLMRKIMAKELGIDDKFDWRNNRFMNNITSTIKKMNINDKKNML